ncbi:bifunctional metallophosphatase/5'-nucleotidase [Hazenella coriacea]|uniref:2',3'-cyclic-nucleotide 2'-phosphodiesterase (5'-nucleotidase family) n=1 Tax=Hazenella coriacea TaxID=1179467 RepID=A0A4R3LCF4_9BACL|nr:bifunctional UDP-sugar hydrolase/5'-nucleotidase [Hazenella coriacea]TCS96988.1 2',3'-cyclic-nucleotide 2'-phosphodiesterase (5'-nucleotidase family) [Hazenella coriacea]
MSVIQRFHLLHTNDIHSHLEQTSQVYTLVSRYRHEWESNGEPVWMLDIGDHTDRERMETEGTDGQINNRILEATQYDLITLGNNELLTFSKPQLNQLYQDAGYRVISSNVVHKETRQPPLWIHPRWIEERGGVRFGFLGATVPYPVVYDLMGWQVMEPIEALERQVKQLKGQVDVLIILSHLGLPSDRMMAEKIEGIDLILGAHTHHLLEVPEQIGDTWIAGAGKFGRYVGHIWIDYDQTKGQIEQVHGECFPTAEELPSSRIDELISEERRRAKNVLSKRITELAIPLVVNYYEESPLGNLLADSLRQWTKADIAIVNSGQLLGSLPMGPVTLEQLHQICPHPINPVLLRIQGREIYHALEDSCLQEIVEKEVYGFGFRGKNLGSLCVSGMTIVYDPESKPRRKICSVQINGKHLAEDEEIIIATVDMFTFGAGYSQFKKGQVIRYFLPEFLRDLLAWRLQQTNAISQAVQNRWQTAKDV